MKKSVKQQLSSLDGFGALSSKTLDALLPFCRALHFEAGEIIFRQNDDAAHCFGVVSGEVEIQHNVCDTSSGPKTLGVLGIGRLFGESALILEKTRSATAVTREPSDILSIDGEKLRGWMHREPKASQPFLLSLMKVSMGRLQRTNLELAAVHAMGRYFSTGLPFNEQLTAAITFLRSTVAGVAAVYVYRRSPYWEEFVPLEGDPKNPEVAALPVGNRLVQELSARRAAMKWNTSSVLSELALMSLPWVESDHVILLPLWDWEHAQDPMQGLMLLASNPTEDPWPERELLLTALVLPIAESLARFSRQEDVAAKARLQQSKDASWLNIK